MARLPFSNYIPASILILAVAMYFTSCSSVSTTSKTPSAGSNPGGSSSSGSTGSGSGGSGSGSGSSSSGSGSSGSGSSGSGGSGSGGSGSGGSSSANSSAPGFAGGTGAAGQNSTAQFLYAAEVPVGVPFAARINQQNGTLTAVASAPVTNANNPLMQAIDPTGSYLYETSSNGILAYTINRQTGALTEMTSSPFDGTQAFVSIAIDPRGKFVYATGSTGVWGYAIQSGGQLAPMAGSPFPTATPSSQFGVYNSLAIDNNDKFLYVTANPGIFAYSIGPNTGALTPVAGSPFKAGNAPLSLVITPSNKFLYETNNTDLTTYGYSIDQNSGVLTEISGSPFTTGAGNQPVADNMTIATQGKFLYIANRGTFSVDPNTGALTRTSSFIPGDWPVINPTGNFLWAITTDQNCWHCNIGVSAYTVDPNTGNLTLVPNSFLVMNNSFSGAIVSLAITK